MTFRTLGVGGAFAPLNCEAVWVEDANATFIKTIGRWCTTTTQGVGESEHLVAWRAKAGPNDVDAVSGATRQDHSQELTAYWDLRDKTGALVPDGVYRVRFENADSNSSTQGQNSQATFTFTKGPARDVKPAASDPLATPLSASPTVAIDYNPRANECDNGIVEQGEVCDPPGTCPTECVSPAVCMSNVMRGSAATCDAQCILTEITTCVDADGCCPDGCSADDDSDCDLASQFSGCATTAGAGGSDGGRGDGNGGALGFGVVFVVGLLTLRRRR